MMKPIYFGLGFYIDKSHDDYLIIHHFPEDEMRSGINPLHAYDNKLYLQAREYRHEAIQNEGALLVQNALNRDRCTSYVLYC